MQDYIDSIRCHRSTWDLYNRGLHSSNNHRLGLCKGFLVCIVTCHHNKVLYQNADGGANL